MLPDLKLGIEYWRYVYREILAGRFERSRNRCKPLCEKITRDHFVVYTVSGHPFTVDIYAYLFFLNPVTPQIGNGFDPPQPILQVVQQVFQFAV